MEILRQEYWRLKTRRGDVLKQGNNFVRSKKLVMLPAEAISFSYHGSSFYQVKTPPRKEVYSLNLAP